jgi:hypothetical protein
VEFIRTHPYLCDYDVKKKVKCKFRGVSEAGFKIHARSQHNWKPDQTLMFKYVDVAGIPQPASAAAAAAPPAPAPAPASSDLPRAFAVGVGGPAPAPKRRLCSKCQQPGHQANSKKCSMKQKLELSSDEDGAVEDGTGEAGESLTE